MTFFMTCPADDSVYTKYAAAELAEKGLQGALDGTNCLNVAREIARLAGASIDAEPTLLGPRLLSHSGYAADLWAYLVRDESGKVIARAFEGLVSRR